MIEAATLETPETEQVLPLDDNGEMAGSSFLEAVVTGKTKDTQPDTSSSKSPKTSSTQAEPAKPTTATETKSSIVDDDDESRWVPPAEIKSEKGREGWREVKREAKAARKEAETLKAKAAELEKQLASRSVPTVPDDVKARLSDLEKERDDLSERLKVADVTSHPRFKQYFDTKTSQLVETAKGIVGVEHAAKIERILKVGDPEIRSERLDELMGELSESKKTRLGAVVANLELLEQERTAEVSKASERWGQMQQQNKEQEQASLAARKEAAERILAASAKLEAFDPGDGSDAKRMAEIETYKQFVRAAVTGNIGEEDAQVLPLAAVQGMYFKTQVIPRLMAQIKELQEQVKAYESAKPRGGTGRGTEAPSGDKTFMSVLGHEDQVV